MVRNRPSRRPLIYTDTRYAFTSLYVCMLHTSDKNANSIACSPLFQVCRVSFGQRVNGLIYTDTLAHCTQAQTRTQLHLTVVPYLASVCWYVLNKYETDMVDILLPIQTQLYLARKCKPNCEPIIVDWEPGLLSNVDANQLRTCRC